MFFYKSICRVVIATWEFCFQTLHVYFHRFTPRFMTFSQTRGLSVGTLYQISKIFRLTQTGSGTLSFRLGLCLTFGLWHKGLHTASSGLVASHSNHKFLGGVQQLLTFFTSSKLGLVETKQNMLAVNIAASLQSRSRALQRSHMPLHVPDCTLSHLIWPQVHCNCADEKQRRELGIGHTSLLKHRVPTSW